MNPKELREQAAELEQLNRDLAAELESRSEQAFTDEEIDAINSRNEQIQKLQRQAESIEIANGYSKRSDITKAIHHVAPKKKSNRQESDLAFRAWLGNGKLEVRDDWRAAAERQGFNYHTNNFNMRMLSESDLLEKRDQSLTNAEGGHTVNDGVVIAFEQALKSYWSWGNLVTVRRTSTGEPIKIPVLDDTSNEAAYTDELAAVSNVGMTFGTPVTLNAYKLTSGVFPISNELIQDSQINISSIVGSGLAERLGRKLSREITLGDGQAGHLDGFVNQTTTGVTADYSDGFIYDDIVDLYFSVNDVYRQNAAWMMHSQTMAYMLKLADSTGRPLFQPFSDPLIGGPRYTLLGKPVVINDWLDYSQPGTPGLGDDVVFFGDWSKLNVRIVRDVNVRTSSELYFKEDAIATIATMRADSKLVDAGQHPIKSLRHSTSSGAASVND